MKIYKCNTCNTLITILDGKNIPSCCGTEMEELTININGDETKHLPSCEIEDGVVEVSIGEIVHPMEKDHYIEFVIAEYKDSLLKYDFTPGSDPVCYFDYEKDMKIYTYCSKHGLWMKKL